MSKEITIITDVFYDKSIKDIFPRGSAILLSNVLMCLIKKYKCKITLYQMSDQNSSLNLHGLNIHFIKCKDIIEYKSILASKSFHFIHFNNPDLFFQTKCKSTLSIHTNYWLNKKDEMEYFINHNEKIMAVNEVYKKQFKSKKIYLIKNGIENSGFFIRKKISSMKNVNIFFPNLPLPNKNVSFAKQVIKVLNKENETKYKLLICGNGKSNRTDIEFIGVIPHAKMPNTYSKCFFTFIPSLSESCSLCMLESMINGCVVIANDIEGLREYVKDGETGFLLNLRTKDWVDKIRQLKLDDFLYDTISTQGHLDILKNNNIKDCAKKYYKVWKSLI